jgi:hypothetical protein
MTKRSITLLGATLALALTSFSAAAADGVKVSCEKRATRSKVEVEGHRLVNGNSYIAEIAPVINGVVGTAVRSTAAVIAAGGEAELEFDSKASEVAEGATLIDANVIDSASPQVQGKLFLVAGGTTTQVGATVTATCRVRNR